LGEAADGRFRAASLDEIRTIIVDKIDRVSIIYGALALVLRPRI